MPTSDLPAGLGLLVLVVDDDADTTESTAALLRLSGHRTLTAQDGPAALTLAQNHQPDVVLLDVAMPRMSGFEVAKRLPRHADGQRPLVIAVSGLSDSEREVPAGARIHGWLRKPFEPEELAGLLRRFQASLTG